MANKKTTKKAAKSTKVIKKSAEAPKVAAPKPAVQPAVQPEVKQVVLVAKPIVPKAPVAKASVLKKEVVVAESLSMENSDLPVPDEAKVEPDIVKETLTISVEELSSAGIVPESVIAEDPDKEEVPIGREVLAAEDQVTIRAIYTTDVPPIVGAFNFQNAVGKDAQSGKPLRGKFESGYVYRVPRYVAAHAVEKNWAILL